MTPTPTAPATFATTDSDTATLAAGGTTQRSRVRSAVNAALNSPKVTSPGGSTSVSDRIATSTKRLNDNVKKFNANVKKVAAGLAGDAKAAKTGAGERGRTGGVARDAKAAKTGAGERPHRHRADRSTNSDK